MRLKFGSAGLGFVFISRIQRHKWAWRVGVEFYRLGIGYTLLRIRIPIWKQSTDTVHFIDLGTRTSTDNGFIMNFLEFKIPKFKESEKPFVISGLRRIADIMERR